MIKTTYICDHCYKEIKEKKENVARIVIQENDKTIVMDKILELCPNCTHILAEAIMNFIQPPRKDV